MDKIEFERSILEKAKPLLRKLYGEFRVDLEQNDRPDAAIFLGDSADHATDNTTPRKIGIEITSIDKQSDLQYLNDEKHGREIANKQLEDSLHNGTPGENPLKRIDVKLPKNYILDGIINKSEKYNDYVKSGSFEEIILLCFSDIITPDSKFMKQGLKHWTDFLLSQANFPFDKVIFVSLVGSGSVQIYNKKHPRIIRPKPYKYDDATITAIQGGFIPVGTHDIGGILNNSPLIQQKNGKKKKPKIRSL